jgi:WD40 repeat protein
MIFSVSYDETIKVWGCTDEQGCDEWTCLETLSGPSAHQSTVWDLVFNEFGSFFVSGNLLYIRIKNRKILTFLRMLSHVSLVHSIFYYITIIII